MYSHLQREFTELQRSHQLLQTRLQQVTWPLLMMIRATMMVVVVMIMFITMIAGKQPDEQLRLTKRGEKPGCTQE